jgi:hypothetical protein
MENGKWKMENRTRGAKVLELESRTARQTGNCDLTIDRSPFSPNFHFPFSSFHFPVSSFQFLVSSFPGPQ